MYENNNIITVCLANYTAQPLQQLIELSSWHLEQYYEEESWVGMIHNSGRLYAGALIGRP
jgi:hypothetical protein